MASTSLILTRETSLRREICFSGGHIVARLVGCSLASWARLASGRVRRPSEKPCPMLSEPGRPPATRVLAAGRGCGMDAGPSVPNPNPWVLTRGCFSGRTAPALLQVLWSASPRIVLPRGAPTGLPAVLS